MVDELDETECAHDDIRPIVDDPDWGRCMGCGEPGFPLTERAAYGDFDCPICHDTGLVPMENPERPHAFADGPCPRGCGGA